MMMVEIAKINGNKIIAIDVDEKHLTLAKKLGADLILNYKDKEKNGKIKSFLGDDELVDIIVLNYIDQDVMDWTMDMIRPLGTIIEIAICQEPISISTWDLFQKHITLKGSTSYHYEEFIEAARMIESETIHYKEIVSKMFPMEKAKEAYEYKIKENALKVILTN